LLQDPEKALTARALAIHARVLTLDTHKDIDSKLAPESLPEHPATREEFRRRYDPTVRCSAQVDFPKMREGNYDCAFFIVYVGQSERTPANYAKAKTDALTKFEAIHRMAEQMYPEQIEIAYSADDAERIHDSGKLVAAIGIENGYVLGQDLSLLTTYHDLGARYITLAHNGHNDIADSAQPRVRNGDEIAEHDGVSEFGAEVIAEMNRLGIMVDVSHISKEAALDAMRLSRAPVIASHSSVHALAAHPRNLDDETLLALRENGGVMQTVAFDGYVKLPPPEKVAARAKLRQDLGLPPRGFSTLTPEQREVLTQGLREIDDQWPGATVSDFVDHIDYMVNLIGLEHVGISSDFDGGGGVEGWYDASETFNVTLELVRRGYNEEEIGMIWSGNLLRVLDDVQRVAAEIQAEG